MRGVQFLVDDDGEKTAVLIDLKKNASSGRTSMTSPSRGLGPKNLENLWKKSDGGFAFPASAGIWHITTFPSREARERS